MLSCLTIAPSDKGGHCGLLLRIVPEDAAKSGRRSDEDWAVVWDDCLRTGGLMPTAQNEFVPLAHPSPPPHPSLTLPFTNH